MANRLKHHMWGVGAGIGAGLLLAPQEDALGFIAELLGSAIGGAVGGQVPDVLEPALSPNHQAVAHGGLAVVGLAYAARAGWAANCRKQATACRERAALFGRTLEEQQADRVEELLWRLVAGLIIGFIGGYASHLALDAGTPRGLPLLRI